MTTLKILGFPCEFTVQPRKKLHLPTILFFFWGGERGFLVNLTESARGIKNLFLKKRKKNSSTEKYKNKFQAHDTLSD